MKILVAGSSGLVGSALINRLTKDLGKFEIVGISSKDLDLKDRTKTFDFLSFLKPQVVIDAAAKVGGIGANNNYPVEFLSDNLQIQCNLIDASHYAKVEKFIFLGSSCIYPRHAKQPIPEEELLNGYLEPTNSAYALAKISGIELIKSYRKEYGHNWISLMPANLYGPGDNFNLNNAHVLPTLIAKFSNAKKNGSGEVELWGDGSPMREFLYVEDLADAVVFCMQNYNGEEHLNIGSGEEVSIQKLAEVIKKIIGFNGQIRWNTEMPNGMPRKILDSSKLLSLGWKPKYSLENGIKKTIEWFLSNSAIRN